MLSIFCNRRNECLSLFLNEDIILVKEASFVGMRKISSINFLKTTQEDCYLAIEISYYHILNITIGIKIIR